ncbi:MAG: hypothetical protein MJ112_08830 [Lachnospiraceae bacterium]|nr:hypothetical protein [Lachnospiraceae bacterium]
MARGEEVFENALLGRNVPILPLDNKWHRLMVGLDKDASMVKLEEEIKELLKRQGKINTEVKQLRKAKTRIMEEMVSAMDESDGATKQEDGKKQIEAINAKLDSYQDEVMDLPKQINELNYQLMLKTMDQCYEIIRDNTSEIEEIADWINDIRIELKKNIVRKQNRELKNQEIYNYMHDIFGAEVIDLFDMKYNPGDRPLQ